MLKKVLSREECAKCRVCCCFDSTDIWEAPVITQQMSEDILKNYDPNQKFLQKDGFYILDMPKEPDEDLYYCTMLDHSKGCKMGENKPFDCRIWPFRVMSLNGTQVITLSPVCPVVKTRPLDKLSELANELAPIIFEQAEKEPYMIKPYINGYPILAVKEN